MEKFSTVCHTNHHSLSHKPASPGVHAYFQGIYQFVHAVT